MLAGAILATAAIPAVAQTESPDDSRWSFGLGAGLHFSRMSFSELDEELYPDNKSNMSGLFSVFGQWEFGHERRFAVRPELNFLTRGGKLTGIGCNVFDYADEEIDDVRYQLKATYLDIRLPLIFQPGNADWRFRPYVYVAPVLGFVTGGRTGGRISYADGSYEGVSYKLSKANINSTYFAGAVGAGLDYRFRIAGNEFFLGIEANYQYGFTDTYSGDEKDGTVDITTGFFDPEEHVAGNRKLSGWELKATLGIPFSVFSRKPAPAPVVYEPAPAPAPVVKAVEPEPVPEHGCYSLDEIIGMMSRGQRVEGKTICAVDDINFDFAKSTIKPSSYAYLDKLAATIIRTKARVRVNGHTDNIGSDDTNMKLSQDRALAVVKYLESKGVPSSRLTYAYYGMSRPLESNDTEEGRRLNRRVEFEILDN